MFLVRNSYCWYSKESFPVERSAKMSIYLKSIFILSSFYFLKRYRSTQYWVLHILSLKLRMVVKMELNETNICVDRVSVAISSEMFDNYVFWTESLGNDLNSGKYILTNIEIGVFFIMYYDKRSRDILLIFCPSRYIP